MKWWLICLGFLCVSEYVVLGDSVVSHECTNGRVWLECAHCVRTCANYAVVDCMGGCVDNIPGCYCPPEWVLDEDTDTCVPAEQCQTCFGPNESWQGNPGHCDLYCPGVGDLMGVCALSAGCFCDVGFVRNEFSICVSSNSCPPSECFNGRVWSECGSCDITCSNRNATCPAVCLRGCYCPSGTVLHDYTGECIPIESCPDTTCKEGQTYQYCGGCQRQCGEQPTACALYCRPAGCYCTAENYALNANGDCVPVDKCPAVSQCDEHEDYIECGPCELNCGDAEFIICTANCKPAKCYCKAGYRRNASGKCVLPAECPTQQCTDGKVWTDCGSCQATCSNYQNLVCAAVCRQGCYCPSGMVVDDVTGQCIATEKCPGACVNGTEWSECGKCHRTCQNQAYIRCQEGCINDVAGCYCPDDLIWDEDSSQCVRPEDCHTCFGEGQVWKANGPCDKHCNKKVRCVENPGPGCYCKENYVQNDDGICIPRDQCPRCTGQGQVWKPNGPCDQHCNIKVKCIADPGPGCYCKEGYVKNDTFDGNCIPRDQCNQCTGQGEVYKPNGPCDRHCNKLVKCLENPGPACYCQDGYVRNEAGICVLQKECPPINPVCRNGKVWMDCGQCINAQSCKTYALVRCSKKCLAAGCYCPDGQVSDNLTGYCVPKDKCRNCFNQNEEWKDPGQCDGRCPGWNGWICGTDIQPGCYCKAGYVRDVNNNCILKSACPLIGVTAVEPIEDM